LNVEIFKLKTLNQEIGSLEKVVHSGLVSHFCALISKSALKQTFLDSSLRRIYTFEI
jgi:hypothetical protein